MLEMTRVTLEKISDPDKYIFFEQEMRRGVIYINKRYSKTSEISIFSILTWIIYMDVLWDNIYLLVILNGSKTDKIKQKLMSKKSNSSTGYVLKVD